MMYRIVNNGALQKKADRKDDPRHVFYEAILLSASFEEYIKSLGGNIAVQPLTYKRPVTAAVEYRYVKENRGWIVEEPAPAHTVSKNTSAVSNNSKKMRERKMKICRYVMTNDSGLAPNPYHDWCTLAVCTPNHQRLDLKEGDWIVGHSKKKDWNRLIYAMRVEEVLTFDQYFNDSRFQKKKPNPLGTPEEQCGDNFYYSENGQWQRLPSWNHNDSEHFISDVGSDLKGCPVFISQDFYYFGDQLESFPPEFKALIQERQGATCKNHEDIYEAFVAWLRGSDEKPNSKGILGCPKFNEPDKSKPMITGFTAHYDPPPGSTEGSKSAPCESSPEGEPELTPGAKSTQKKQSGCG